MRKPKKFLNIEGRDWNAGFLCWLALIGAAAGGILAYGIVLQLMQEGILLQVTLQVGATLFVIYIFALASRWRRSWRNRQ